MLFMAAALCAVEVCLLEFHREKSVDGGQKMAGDAYKNRGKPVFLILF